MVVSWNRGTKKKIVLILMTCSLINHPFFWGAHPFIKWDYSWCPYYHCICLSPWLNGDCPSFCKRLPAGKKYHAVHDQAQGSQGVRLSDQVKAPGCSEPPGESIWEHGKVTNTMKDIERSSYRVVAIYQIISNSHLLVNFPDLSWFRFPHSYSYKLPIYPRIMLTWHLEISIFRDI